ncbi:Rieske 2Fe-2S domain-containing protein, partial [Bacillus sp. SIMBA_069]
MIVQDAVLRNEWIVACRSTDVLDRPTQVTIMGERIVLFRNEEGIHAFKDLCIHRGAALSLGC